MKRGASYILLFVMILSLFGCPNNENEVFNGFQINDWSSSLGGTNEDQGGGSINNAWLIWTISFIILILLGIAWELWARREAENMLFKIRREGIIRIIPSVDGPSAVFYKTKIHTVLFIVCFSICSLISGIFIGRALPRKPEVRFYANVLENKEAYLLVEGIPENDINHRSQFTVSLKDKKNKTSILDKDGKPISFSNIPEGCLVNIVYDGIVIETFPGQISGAILIKIIE